MDEPAPPIALPRRVITSIVLALVAVLVAVTGFRQLAAMRKESVRTDAAVLAPLVRAERARRIDYTETLRGFGRAEPLRRSVVPAEVDGVVREISPLLESGTAVGTKSDTGTENGGATGALESPVLVRLDARDLEDRLARARAEVEAALADVGRLEAAGSNLAERLAISEEELDAATRELRRIAGLVPKTLTASDLDAQKMQVTLRRSGVLQLASQIRENAQAVAASTARHLARQKDVELAVRDVERTTIRAPFRGRIEMRHVSLGERVRVGDPLFTIVDLSRVQIPVALPAGRYAEVAPDAPARLHLPAGDEAIWEGTLARIAPQINAAERTFYAYIVVTGDPTRTPVPPGAHVVAEVDGRTHEQVVPLPRQAFLGKRIFIAKATDDPDTFEIEERTPVVRRYLAGVALVEKGVEQGELYLVTNLESVAHGSRVRLAPEDEAPARGGGSK